MQVVFIVLVEYYDVLWLCYWQDGGCWYQFYGVLEEVVLEWYDLGMYVLEVVVQVMQDQVVVMQGSFVFECLLVLCVVCFDLGYGEL